MAYSRSRSRHRSRPQSSAGSVSPTIVDSGAPSRIASTIDLPREQDYPETNDHSYYPYQTRATSQPRHHVRTRRSKNSRDSLAKGAIVIGLLAAAAGMAHLAWKKEKARREEQQRQRDEYDRSERDRRRKRRDEEARSRRYRQAQSDMNDWRERADRPRIANEAYEGSSRGHGTRAVEWRSDRSERRDDRRSSYGDDRSRG